MNTHQVRGVSRLALAAFSATLALAAGCAQFEKMPSLPTPTMFSKTPQHDPLTTAMTGKVPTERIAAIKKLAGAAHTEQRDQVAGQLASLLSREPSPPIRSELCTTLGQFNNPAADQAVRAALKDTTFEVRIAAAQALAKHGGRGLAENVRNRQREDATRSLLATTAADDGTLDVRLAAVRSLGQFDGEETKAALGVVLDDSNPAVQRRAIHALASSTGKDFGNDVRAWREYVKGGTPTPRTETIADKMKTVLYSY